MADLPGPLSPVLAEILTTNQVRDAAGNRLPLRAAMSEGEGRLIAEMFGRIKPDVSVEIGFAYGVSTMFACAALAANGKPCRHIVIDPAQSREFDGIGLLNIERAGYRDLVDFREAPSEIALPELLRAGTRIQLAIIDGWHTFDHALIDFFYVNKMLDVGGAVIFDDVNMPALTRLIAHVATYPAYRIVNGTAPPRAPNGLVALRRRMNSAGLSRPFARQPDLHRAAKRSRPTPAPGTGTPISDRSPRARHRGRSRNLRWIAGDKNKVGTSGRA